MIVRVFLVAITAIAEWVFCFAIEVGLRISLLLSWLDFTIITTNLSI